jgi:hypothetical protein
MMALLVSQKLRILIWQIRIIAIGTRDPRSAASPSDRVSYPQFGSRIYIV